MSASAIALGVLLGALGGLWHLAVTRWRATRVADNGVALTLLTLPLGLLGPAAAVLIASQVAPEAAWATLPGLVLARFVVLHRLRRDP